MTTYRYAMAHEPKASPYDNLHGLGKGACLVVLDLGADGVERTVLMDTSITEIGGKRFLAGTVTDKFTEIAVVFPGKPAYVALDRIAYIQILELPAMANDQ